MKKVVISIVILVFVLVGILGAVTWTTGKLTEVGVETYMADLDEAMPDETIRFGVPNYERGFLSSESSTSVSVGEPEEEKEFVLKHLIYHGPLAMTPDGMKPGMSYIITTLDREALTEESQSQIQGLWGDVEPFTIRTLVDLTGKRKSVLDVEAVDATKDGKTIQFAGASGEFNGNADNSTFSGNINITEFEMTNSKAGEEGTMKMSESSLIIDFAEGEKILVNGSLGKMHMQFPAESGEMLLKSDGAVIEVDQVSLKGFDNVMVGTSNITLPGFTFSSPALGNVTTGELSIISDAKEEGGMVTNSIAYKIDSVDGDFPIPPEEKESMAIYLDLLKEGMHLTASASLPVEAMQELSGLQQGFQAQAMATDELSKEQKEQMVSAIENTMRKTQKGTGIAVEVKAGSDTSGASVDLSIAYDGDVPITAKKTYKEILDVSAVKLSASVTKDILSAYPEVAEKLGMMITMGAVLDTPKAYTGSATIENGSLKLNGKSNLMFQAMSAQLTSQEINWDEFFDGMRSAAE